MENKILEQLTTLNEHLSHISSTLKNTSSFNWQSLIGGLIGGLIGFISALALQIIIGPIKYRLFGPKLELKFNNNEYAYKTEIIKNHITTHYIRVEVVNTGRKIAKQCRAYLVNVEKENSSGEFVPTHYKDSLQLCWAAKNEKKDYFIPLDLSKDISQFINVIVIEEPNKYQTQVREDLYSYKKLLEGEHGKFRYTIHVSGDNVNPAFIKIISKWNGTWENYEVYLGK